MAVLLVGEICSRTGSTLRHFSSSRLAIAQKAGVFTIVYYWKLNKVFPNFLKLKTDVVY